MNLRTDPIATTSVILVSAVLLTVIVISFANSVFFTNSRAENTNLVTLSAAEALPLDSSLEEAVAQTQGWISVEFPFHWRNQFADTRAVWYRMSVDRGQLEPLAATNRTDNSLLGIYIWRLNQTADIWFNGIKIGSGGSTTEPMARYWNSPLYFTIPPGLLRDENEILIKHFAQNNWGSMEEIVIGQDAFLKSVYNARYFIQHDVALGLFVFVFVTGLFSFAVWAYRRQETEYLWFFIASIGLSFFCLNQFIRYLPIDADFWRWLSNVSTDLWAVSMFMFIVHSLKLSKPRSEKIVLLYLFSGIPVYFYASFAQVFDINIFYHLGSLSIGVYCFYICTDQFLRTRQKLPAFYACVILLAFIAGVHDTAMQAILNNGWFQSIEPGFRYHFNFVHFAAPLIFLLIGASLIKRFITSMNAADRLNEELEQRIEEARQELDENYQAIEKVLIRQSASEERERIYRDLHDDVGSKLLSLYYRLDNESDSTLAKSALEDLRDIVSRKFMESCPLSKAVQYWKSEAFARVQDAGISLSWQFDSTDPDPILDGSQYAQLRRMFREVISNAILHSTEITHITADIRATDGCLCIAITNNGATAPASSWQAGRGINNLRVRSRDLNGEFSITDLAEQSVQVAWKVPLNS